MSLHTVVNDLFQSSFYDQHQGRVQLSNADVNRIVTSAVQKYDQNTSMNTLLTNIMSDYIAKYKAPKKGGCRTCSGKRRAQ